MTTPRPSHRILANLLLLAGSSLPVAAQVDGGLDDSFWSDGKVALSSSYRSVQATVVAPDGRLVVVGIRDDPGGEESLFWSVLNDGSLEPPCVPNSPGGATYARAKAAAFDPQGRLLIGGQATFGTAGPEGFALRYLYPACDLDEGFNSDGIYRTNLEWGVFEGIAFDSSSKVVLAGSVGVGVGAEALLVVRLTEAGLLDPDFGFFGVLELDLAEHAVGHAVAVQPDDRIVVGGEIYSSESGYDFLVVRLDAQGDLDPSFTGDGSAQVDVQTDLHDLANALVLDPVSGNILIAGYSSDASASTKFAVVRLLSNGLPDETFDDDGIWTAAFREEDYATSIELQSDGKILVAGNSHDEGSGDLDFLIYRLLSNGDPDSSFDGNGRAGVSFGLAANPLDHVNSTTLHAGKLVVAGHASDQDGPGSIWRAIVARLWIGLIFSDDFERGSGGGWSSAPGAP